MSVQPLTISLGLAAVEGEDANDVDVLSRTLLAEIEEELDTLSVELEKAGEIPPGARSVDPMTLGAILIVALPAILPNLVTFFQNLSLRGFTNNVTIKTQFKDKIIEATFPLAAPHSEIRKWIEDVTQALNAQKK